jgi:microcystin-dependent protein
MIIGKGAASAQGTVADERLSETLKGGLGSFGGSMSATLNQTDAIPNHRHNFVDKGSNTSVATSSNSNATGYALTDPIAYESYATFTEGAKTSGLDWPSPNNVVPHQNLPPYFVVGFKMFVGYGD